MQEQQQQLMSFLDKITGKSDFASKAVPTPEWPAVDGEIFVRKLSAIQRAEFYVSAARLTLSGAAFQSFVVAFCAMDCAGDRCFADADWDKLQHEPCTVIERIADAADDLNILSDRARGALKKNSESAEPCGDTLNSPEKTESA
jgi:hypothetical protein